jgi:hypothetical protein
VLQKKAEELAPDKAVAWAPLEYGRVWSWDVIVFNAKTVIPTQKKSRRNKKALVAQRCARTDHALLTF